MKNGRLKFWTAAVVLACSPLMAVLYNSKKDFVKRNMPVGVSMSKVTVEVQEEDRAGLTEAWKLRDIPAELKFYVGKKDGKIDAAVAFVVLHGYLNDEYHHVAVALNGDGSVKEVNFVDLQTDWPQKVANKAFFGQFAGKPVGVLQAGEGIDAVSGATESSETVIEAVNTVMGIYLKYVK